MSNQNPTFLKPHDGLTATQRKSLGLGPPIKFVRDPAATPSRTFVNSTITSPYRTGDGEQANYTSWK